MSGAAIDRNALVENCEPPLGALADGVLGMREKIETAFGTDMPPRIFQSSFDAAIQQQTAAFHDLNSRIERLESAEMMDLRDAMREICEAVANLALEHERNAKMADGKFTSLTDALQAQIDAGRDRAEKMQAQADANQSANEQVLSDIQSSLKALEQSVRERANTMQAQADATQSGNELALSEIKQSLKALETNLSAANQRGDELSRNLVTMSNEILDVTKAALKDQGTRIAALDSRDQEMTRGMAMMKEDLGNATAALLRGQRARLEQAEKAITEIQTGGAQMVDRVTTLEAGSEEVQRRLAAAAHDITVLEAYDAKFNEQQEVLQTFTDDLAREFKVVKADLVELHETAATVQAHQAVLEQSEGLMAELKDRQTRSAMRMEAFIVRHDELVGEVRLARADIEEGASLQRAHQRQLHEMVEKTATEIRDRQTQSAARIDMLAGAQEDVASLVRVAQTDLKEVRDTVKAQASIQIDTDKAIAELKDRQTRAALRLDHHDARHEVLSADLRAAKAELEKTSAAAIAHQARLDDAEKTHAEFRDRHTRAAMRMDAADVRHDGLAGDLRNARTDIGEHGAALNIHRQALEQTEKALTELKDRQTRSAMRMDSMDLRHEDVAGELVRAKAKLEEKSITVDQHQLVLEETEKTLADLKDRQIRSAGRIETIDGRLEETSTNLRATITDLQEAQAAISTHQTLLDQNAKLVAELKDARARAGLRIDNIDSRLEEVATDMGVAKASLSALADTPNALRAHQSTLNAQEAVIGELKDKSQRAQSRIEGLDSRQNEFASELGVVKAGVNALTDTPNQLRSHQVSIEGAQASIGELKDRQTRAAQRLESLDKIQGEFAGEMRVVQAGLSTLSDTPNLLRSLSASLDQADKAIAELKDRQDRSHARIEAQSARHEEFSGEMSSLKAGLFALSDMPNLLRAVEQATEETQKSINEIKDRNARAQSRLEALGHRQQEVSIEISTLKTGVAALSETPNQLRALSASLEETDKAIAELRERGGRAATRIDVLDNRLGEFKGEMSMVKGGLTALGETPNILRGHDTLLDAADKAIGEIKERHARAAARIETLSANLGDLTGKLEAQSELARMMDERLRENEKQLAKASDRERALAQLHARAADTLRDTEQG